MRRLLNRYGPEPKILTDGSENLRRTHAPAQRRLFTSLLNEICSHAETKQTTTLSATNFARLRECVSAWRLIAFIHSTNLQPDHTPVFVPAYTLSSAGISLSPKVVLTTYAKAPALLAARM